MANATRAKSDRVCDMCGGIGLAKQTVICCKCKRASQHIYCMLKQLHEITDTWQCDECLVSDVLAKQKVAEPACSNIVHQVASSKQERVQFADTPSGKDMMQPPFRNPSFKTIESAKVKYISAKEVALLTSGGKVYERKTSLGAASKEPGHTPIKSIPILQRTSEVLIRLPPILQRTTPEVSTKSPPISQRASPYMSALATPKSTKITCDPNETYAGADVHLCFPPSSMEGKNDENKSSGEKISTSFCNETLIRRSVGAELHISSSKGKRATSKSSGFAEWEEVSPSKSIKYNESIANKKSLVAVGKPAEQKAVDKPQWNCSYDVRSPQAHTPDKQKTMPHDEIALNDLTASSGYVSCGQQENLTNCPASETCWKGTFEVFDIASHIYNGIQAHMSAKASPKVRDILKKMPEELKFKMLRRTDVWPKTFQYDPPDNKDIGLYFFPSDQERPKKMYDLLLQWVDLHDFAMQSHISDIELLIFTSKQLPEDCQRIGTEAYLWGIFRNMKYRKRSRCVFETLLSHKAGGAMTSSNCNQPIISIEGKFEEVDMEVDMIGGTEIGRIDKPIPRFVAPRVSARATSEDAYYIKGSVAMFPLKKVGSTTVLDVAPGFSRSPSSRHGITPPKTVPTGCFASTSSSRGYDNKASDTCPSPSGCHQVGYASNRSTKHENNNLYMLSPKVDRNYPTMFSPKASSSKLCTPSPKVDSSNPCMLSPKVEAGASPVYRHSSTNWDMSLPSSCSKDKWMSKEAIEKRKEEIQKRLDAINKQAPWLSLTLNNAACSVSPPQLPFSEVSEEHTKKTCHFSQKPTPFSLGSMGRKRS